ncbi:MAG TPA: NAD(P)/FAD-dependent oxidoreductase [Steroidobacteraceae bacterium]|nr:NAD(P)/FAD-dependent oxidoreductase [Steroidobacteraceae bacterium]
MRPSETEQSAVSQPDSNNPDVIVVGASLAGCTAARLYAQHGLRVALVEQQREAGAFKHLCTHFIQASATPVLKAIGLDQLIEQAGGVRNSVDIWTRYGWAGEVPPEDAAGNRLFGYNIRRQRLDPMLRELVAQASGVSLLSGCSVRGLIRERGAIVGVEVGGRHSGALRARLVVAADGRNSPSAELAGVRPKSAPNCRGGAFAAYRAVPLRRGNCSQMWFYGDDVGYVFPNEDGLTVIAYMMHKDKLPAFREDAAKALEASLAALPDAPDLKRAQPLGRPVLVKDYPSEWRPTIVQGMALIGDAQMSLDPLWGVGCGFAFQTAQWLVDCTASSLRSDAPLAPGLKRYARTVTQRLGGHRFLMVDFAKRRRFNAIERLMFSAAAKDRQMARHLYEFGARLSSPMQFLSPRALLRAIWVNVRHSDARGASLNVPS